MERGSTTGWGARLLGLRMPWQIEGKTECPEQLGEVTPERQHKFRAIRVFGHSVFGTQPFNQ